MQSVVKLKSNTAAYDAVFAAFLSKKVEMIFSRIILFFFSGSSLSKLTVSSCLHNTNVASLFKEWWSMMSLSSSRLILVHPMRGSPSALMSVFCFTVSKFEFFEIFIHKVDPSLPLASSTAVSVYFSFHDASDGNVLLLLMWPYHRSLASRTLSIRFAIVHRLHCECPLPLVTLQ